MAQENNQLQFNHTDWGDIPRQQVSPASKEEFKFKAQRLLQHYQLALQASTSPDETNIITECIFKLGHHVKALFEFKTALDFYRTASLYHHTYATLALARYRSFETSAERFSLERITTLMTEAYHMEKIDKRKKLFIQTLQQIDRYPITNSIKIALCKQYIRAIADQHYKHDLMAFWDSVFKSIAQWPHMDHFKTEVIGALLLTDYYQSCTSLLTKPAENQIDIEQWLQCLQFFGQYFPEYGHFKHQCEYLAADLQDCLMHKKIHQSGLFRQWLPINDSSLKNLAKNQHVLANLFLMSDGEIQKNASIQPILQALEQPLMENNLALSRLYHYYQLASYQFEHAQRLFKLLNQTFLQANEKPRYWHDFVALNTSLHHRPSDIVDVPTILQLPVQDNASNHNVAVQRAVGE